jgi:hypothetical protein
MPPPVLVEADSRIVMETLSLSRKTVRSIVAATCFLLSLTVVLPAARAAARPTHGETCNRNADGSVVCNDHQETDTVSVAEADAIADRGAAEAITAPAALSGPRNLVGEWTGAQPWDVIGIAMSLLPDGKVLAWDQISDTTDGANDPHTFVRAQVWDPVTGTRERVDNTSGYNLFCAGYAKLPSGEVFAIGGNANANNDGIKKSTIFDPVSKTWRTGTDSAYPRWYPSVSPMANGDMLVVGGTIEDPAFNRTTSLPEIRSLDDSIRTLPGVYAGRVAADLPWERFGRLYPWITQAPDGRAMFLGPADDIGFIDTAGTGSFAPATPLPDVGFRFYGGYAPYDAVAGKVLITGGGPSNNKAYVVDLNTGAWSPTGSMARNRKQHNTTILPDGSVIVNGGMDTPGYELINLPAAVTAVEHWTPSTGAWNEWANEPVKRQYHSSSLLLPDGRVLSAGGGYCGECTVQGYTQKNYTIFSPPYLFDGAGSLAARPTVTSVAPQIAYGKPLAVDTPQAANIAKVALMRLGSPTHSQDSEQRFVPLQFTRQSGAITVTGPSGPTIATPGYYMLFLVDTDGVPSVAKIINVGTVDNPAPGTAITPGATPASMSTPSAFTPLATPDRILDTRNGIGITGPKPAANDTVVVPILGRSGVPATGVTGVVMNVTATDATQPGYVTVWPDGAAPLASSLNLDLAGQTRANLVTVPVGADGSVRMLTSGGAHLIADVVGFYRPVSSSSAGRMKPLTPDRLLDTRNSTKPLPDSTTVVPVLGRAGVPASGVSAVVLNVTATNTTGAGFVTVWPSGPRPVASNVNPTSVGQSIPNQVIVPVGADGSIRIYTDAGTDLAVDAMGWFTDSSAPNISRGLFIPVSPYRVLDTRNGARPAANGTVVLRATSPGTAAFGRIALAMNVTATDPVGDGFVTVWPDGARPTTSSLNVSQGAQTIANHVTIPSGSDGAIRLSASSATHLVGDVSGWYVE